MTKKAMKEKYLIKLEDAQSKIKFYKEEVEKCISAYCTLEEEIDNDFRKLVRMTFDRVRDEHRQELLRDWTYYQKAKREATIIVEILTDIQ